jgi:hypothetical protein
MERMEQERAEMVAEVEAQIERALASMAVELDDSDYGSSRPQSRLSNVSGSRSRRASDASKARHLRSFGTESTLAESYAEDIEAVEEEEETTETIVRETSTIAEDEEEPTTKKKRFSASELEVPQDGMNAVDEGISQKSDKIAQKVLEIQQKVFVNFCNTNEFLFNNLFSLNLPFPLIAGFPNGNPMSRAAKIHSRKWAQLAPDALEPNAHTLNQARGLGQGVGRRPQHRQPRPT